MWSGAVREGRGVPGDPIFEGDLWVVRRGCMLNGCLLRPHHMYVSTGYEMDGLVRMVRQGRLTVGDGWRNMCVSEGMVGEGCVCEGRDGWRRMCV
jgi:hypothetical protein